MAKAKKAVKKSKTGNKTSHGFEKATVGTKKGTTEPLIKDDDGLPKCDSCDNNATINRQLVWIEWSIDEEGNYSTLRDKGTRLMLEADGPEDEDNLHFCKDCAEKDRI
jgi:hypothetical protein